MCRAPPVVGRDCGCLAYRLSPALSAPIDRAKRMAFRVKIANDAGVWGQGPFAENQESYCYVYAKSCIRRMNIGHHSVRPPRLRKCGVGSRAIDTSVICLSSAGPGIGRCTSK